MDGWMDGDPESLDLQAKARKKKEKMLLTYAQFFKWWGGGDFFSYHFFYRPEKLNYFCLFLCFFGGNGNFSFFPAHIYLFLQHFCPFAGDIA